MSMASMRFLFTAYAGDLAYSRKSISHTSSISSKEGSDKMRPLGIPAYEDKLVQGVMRIVLDQTYEGKFYNFSFGYWEGKSCHQAIREINQLIMTRKTNFIVDADIKGLFDNLDRE